MTDDTNIVLTEIAASLKRIEALLETLVADDSGDMMTMESFTLSPNGQVRFVDDDSDAAYPVAWMADAQDLPS